MQCVNGATHPRHIVGLLEVADVIVALPTGHDGVYECIVKWRTRLYTGYALLVTSINHINHLAAGEAFCCKT